MPQPYSATSQVSASAPALPDGEAKNAAILRELLDNRLFFRDALIGHLSWNGELSADKGGSNSVFSINVGAINEIVLSAAGAYKTFASSGTTIGASKISGGGNLANGTHYYVYAWDNGGLDYEISTTAPSAARVFKTGDATRRYLGCFVTDGAAGWPLPFRATRGRYIFRRSAFTAPGNLNLLAASTTPVGWTDLSLAALLPPHARVAILDVNVFGGTGSAYLDLRTKGDTTDVSLHVLGGSGAASGDAHGSTEMETDSSRVVQYTLALGSGATLVGNIWLTGFVE